jgi:hypothetical protein
MRIFVLTYDKTFDQKPILFLRKCAKTRVRQCTFSKNCPGVIPPDPLLGEGRKKGGVLGDDMESVEVGEKTREGMEEDRVGNGRGEGKEGEGGEGRGGEGKRGPPAIVQHTPSFEILYKSLVCTDSIYGLNVDSLKTADTVACLWTMSP